MIVVTLHMVDIQIIVGQGKSYLSVEIENGEHIDVLLPRPRPYWLPSNPSPVSSSSRSALCKDGGEEVEEKEEEAREEE